jgi:hypothetical protein
MRRTFAITFCLLFLFSAIDAEAQRRRTRWPVRVRLYISPAKISADLVGLTVPNVPRFDGRPGGSWTFVEDEPKEITVVETKPTADAATVAINIVTHDANSILTGKLRLYYGRVGREWILNSVENLNARLLPKSREDYSAREYERPQEPYSRAPQRFALANSSFALPPGYFQSFPINIPSEVGAGRVYGRFQATQGNNVQVHIVDADGFTNLKNRSQYLAFYESGRVTVGTIDVRLRPGLYYLVFENLYSTFSNKVVQANVFLEY